MVLYTPAAQAAAGGTTAIRALINSAIALTNTSYANSSVAQRVRLVYAGSVAYTEGADIFADRNNITSGAGTLSDVAALRNLYRADLVTLVTHKHSASACGVAWIMETVMTPGFDEVPGDWSGLRSGAGPLSIHRGVWHAELAAPARSVSIRDGRRGRR